jgi:hypothetical protein
VNRIERRWIAEKISLPLFNLRLRVVGRTREFSVWRDPDCFFQRAERTATSGGLVTFMREQLFRPIPSPVVPGQVTEKFREAVKALAKRQKISVHQFDHQERKDHVANRIRRHRQVRDGVVFISVTQEKTQAFQGKKIDRQVQYTRDQTVYVKLLLLH